MYYTTYLRKLNERDKKLHIGFLADCTSEQGRAGRAQTAYKFLWSSLIVPPLLHSICEKQNYCII